MSEEATNETPSEEAGEVTESKDILYPSEEATGESTEAGEETGETKEETSDKPEEGEEKPEEGDKEEGEEKSEDAGEELKVEDLEFGEGEVDQERAKEFVELVKGLGELSPKEQANKLLELQRGIYADQIEAHTAKVDAWAEETKADKEIGGENLEANLAIAAKARDEFGGEGLTAVLDQTGVGNHPEVIKFFYNIGKAISDDSFVQGSASSTKTEKSHAQILYGGSSKS